MYSNDHTKVVLRICISLTKSMLVAVFVTTFVMLYSAQLAKSDDKAITELVADFKKVLQEKDYQTSMSRLDELSKKSERLGIDFAPTYYLQALRQTTHGNGQQYDPFFKASNSGVIASAFLLPDLNSLSSILPEQKQRYITQSFDLLQERTFAGNWVTPLMMMGVVKQRLGIVRSTEAWFHWYSNVALEGASPAVNAIVLASRKNGDAEIPSLCESIAMSGSILGNPACSGFSQNSNEITNSLKKGVEKYKHQIEENLGPNFEAIKSLVCGELKPEFASGLVCYDALASVDELCFIRTKSHDYPELERVFVCDRTDVRWANDILAGLLKDSLTWSIEK